ncbi:MAG TPA: hypothetical protein VGB74_04980 [Actinoplanes sp.]|jgi:hypothetical protein
MRSLGTRRAALAAGAATVALIALGACSAGQVAETALLKAPVSGLSTQSPDGSLLIRNLQVIYNSPIGYPAGGNAPLELSLFNQTQQPITVLISSPPAQEGTEGVVSARQVGVATAARVGEAPPTTAPSPATDPLPGADPSASAPAPAGPALQPAKFTIAPLSTESFLPGDTDSLQLVGLSDKLAPGISVSLVIETSLSNQPIVVQAPFAMPLSPVSRAPGIEHENAEE